MNSNKLKIIAIITMLIDHIGAVLFPSILIFRIIGRISFPIFGFLIVQGALHTKNKSKYLTRLLLFALISEIPYDLAFSKSLFDFKNQNIFFTLSLALVGIFLIKRMKEEKNYIETTSWIFVLLALAKVINVDYSYIGVLFIIMMYVLRKNNVSMLLALSLSFVFMSLEPILGKGFNPIYLLSLFAIFSVVPIYFYNGKKGKMPKVAQMGFYLFYPIHLIVLYVISQYSM